MAIKSYKLSPLSWIFYDFANSAYHLLVITILFPLCFKQALKVGNGNTDAVWSLVVSVPVLSAGLLAPFLGAYADQRNMKVVVFRITAIITIALTFFLAVTPASAALLAILFFAFGMFFFELSQSVYNAFLPTQQFGDRHAYLSGLGWGIGYLGGILCMPLAFLLVKGKVLPADYYAYQAAFAVVGIYFLVFALPSLIFIRDESISGEKAEAAIKSDVFRAVIETIKNWRRHRNIFGFLIAFYLINDGLSTLVFFTSIFAASTLRMSTNEIMLAFLIVQLVGIPATILLCWIAEKWGYKNMMLSTIIMWILNACGFLMVRNSIHLYILSVTVGLVIGTTPAIARAILATMVAKTNATEIYGFHAFAGRASAVFGPLLFGLVSSITGNQRFALTSLVVFFTLGFIILLKLQFPPASVQSS